jgi:hypothetical protein
MTLFYALAKVSTELIAIYFHSFEIFIIQIGEMAFCNSGFIIMKSNYFQNAQKSECFLNFFEAIVREIARERIVVREHRFRAILCGREMSF